MQSSQDSIQGRTRSLDFRGTAPWHPGLEPRSAQFWVHFIAVTLQKCTTFTCEKFQGLRVGSQPSDASFACTQGRTHSPHSRRARGIPFWMMGAETPYQLERACVLVLKDRLHIGLEFSLSWPGDFIHHSFNRLFFLCLSFPCPLPALPFSTLLFPPWDPLEQWTLILCLQR